MLATEISTPVIIIAALRQLEAISSAKAAARPRISELRIARRKRESRSSIDRSTIERVSWFIVWPWPSLSVPISGQIPRAGFLLCGHHGSNHVDQPGDASRSEERRVEKEGRS